MDWYVGLLGRRYEGVLGSGSSLRSWCWLVNNLGMPASLTCGRNWVLWGLGGFAGFIALPSIMVGG